MKLNTRYTVILLPVVEPKDYCDAQFGICFDESGDEPAYYKSEKEAQTLLDTCKDSAPNRQYVIGTITFYTEN